MPYTDTVTIKPLLCGNETHLGATPEDFDTQVNTMIRWATAEINNYLGRSFSDQELATDADLAATIESITFQAVDNHLLTIIQRKQSPIVTVNDFAVRSPARIVLTDDMKKALDKLAERRKEYPSVSFVTGVERLTSSKTGLIPGNGEVV